MALCLLRTWWHFPCTGLDENCIASDEPWVCASCLIDIADSIDRDTGIEKDPKDEDTLHSINQICRVCYLDSIPVGGEHVCCICKKAVYAW